MAAIKVSVQAEPRDMDSWSSLARRLESSGCEALVMGDHPRQDRLAGAASLDAALVWLRSRLLDSVMNTAVAVPDCTAAVFDGAAEKVAWLWDGTTEKLAALMQSFACSGGRRWWTEPQPDCGRAGFLGDAELVAHASCPASIQISFQSV